MQTFSNDRRRLIINGVGSSSQFAAQPKQTQWLRESEQGVQQTVCATDEKIYQSITQWITIFSAKSSSVHILSMWIGYN